MANLKTAVTETVEAETMYLHTPLIRQEKQPQASILAAFEAIWKGFHWRESNLQHQLADAEILYVHLLQKKADRRSAAIFAHISKSAIDLNQTRWQSHLHFNFSHIMN